MVAELASLDQLAWIGVNKSGFVGVSRACQFALSAWAIPLVSGPVVTQDPKGLMQRSASAQNNQARQCSGKPGKAERLGCSIDRIQTYKRST